jgi:hypothetical protein
MSCGCHAFSLIDCICLAIFIIIKRFNVLLIMLLKSTDSTLTSFSCFIASWYLFLFKYSTSHRYLFYLLSIFVILNAPLNSTAYALSNMANIFGVCCIKLESFNKKKQEEMMMKYNLRNVRY